MTHKQEVEIEGIPYEVEYIIHRGASGLHTLPNGDPGYPDDADELEIVSVITYDEDGHEINATYKLADDAADALGR